MVAYYKNIKSEIVDEQYSRFSEATVCRRNMRGRNNDAPVLGHMAQCTCSHVTAQLRLTHIVEQLASFRCAQHRRSSLTSPVVVVLMKSTAVGSEHWQSRDRSADNAVHSFF